MENIFDWYFAPKKFEENGKVYENLGVRAFKKGLLKATQFVVSKKKYSPSHYYLQGRSLENLIQYEQETRILEFQKVLGTIIGLALIPAGLYESNETIAGIGLTIAGLGGYSTILQRYNRARIYPVIEKLKSKGSVES